jgi:hypothetical protein
MKTINRIFLIFITVVWGVNVSFGQKSDEACLSKDIPSIPALAIGKWMIAPDQHPAKWLDEKYYGKTLREPINIIIVDERTSDLSEARNNLYAACKSAGFEVRTGHSGGYAAFIADKLYSQFPSEKNHAFSSAPFEFNNNHGRVFGPHFVSEKTIFTAAFSREEIDPLDKVKHGYSSFNRARDSFAGEMDRQTCFKIKKFVNLENGFIADPQFTTGDHDGIAVLLVCEKK